MSNIKGQPGYIDMSAKPDHKPKPMAPRGSVTPAAKPKKPSGKERKAMKDRAARLVEKTLNSPEWFVLAYRVNQETGAVELAYEMCNFPHNSFEDAAHLFANVLTKTLGEDFNPNPAAAQKSEFTPANIEAAAEAGRAMKKRHDDELRKELDAIPNSLGAPSEPPEPGQGEPD